MNEDTLNMGIRRFLKKVGISSQREIEKEIYNAEKNGILKTGDKIDLEMSLKIKNYNFTHVVEGEIYIEDWLKLFFKILLDEIDAKISNYIHIIQQIMEGNIEKNSSYINTTPIQAALMMGVAELL